MRIVRGTNIINLTVNAVELRALKNAGAVITDDKGHDLLDMTTLLSFIIARQAKMQTSLLVCVGIIQIASLIACALLLKK